MSFRMLSEGSFETTNFHSYTSPGCIAITISQHGLLWSALYAFGSTLYVIGVQAVFTNDIAVVVLLMVAVSKLKKRFESTANTDRHGKSVISLFYIILQNVTTRLRKNARNRMQGERVDIFQALATHTLKILSTLWLVTVGLSITFTAARQPLCTMGTTERIFNISALDRGNTCIVHRVGIITSCIAL